MTTTVTRADLAALCSNAPPGIREKLIRFFEDLFGTASGAAVDAGTAAGATSAIQDATVLTLSPNAAFNYERVLTEGTGITITDNGAGATATIALSSPITTVGGYSTTFNLPSDVVLNLRSNGTVPSSDDGPYANDAAAAAAGIEIGEWYAKTGGTVAWRQV